MLLKNLIDKCFVCGKGTFYWEAYVTKTDYSVIKECKSDSCDFYVKEHFSKNYPQECGFYFYNGDYSCKFKLTESNDVFFFINKKLEKSSRQFQSTEEALEFIQKQFDNLLLL